MVVVVLVGFYAFQATNTPQLSQATVPNLVQAMRTVPAADYPGADAPGLPRPRGSTRSYYVSTSQVTTIVYTERSTIAIVRTELEPLLHASGWQSVTGPVASPSPLSGATSAWRTVLVKGSSVLQLTAFQERDVTAVTYIVQGS